MKALYVAHYFLPNMAAGVTTKEILKMLLQKRHRVTLIATSTYTNDNSGMSNYNGLRTISAFTGIPRLSAQQSKLAAMLVSTVGYISMFIIGFRTLKKGGTFSAIIAQHHPFHLASLTSYLLSILLKIPLVIKVHDITPSSPTKNKIETFYSTLLSKASRVAFAHADCILCTSTEMAELVSQLGLEEDIVVVFPNTVDVKRFSSSQHADDLRGRLNLEGKKVVLFMASAFEARGLDILLKALRIVEDERVFLVVVGPYDRRYGEVAERLQVRDRVIFVGQVDHELIPTYIHMADVCVGPLVASPYSYGMVPRKVIEYMACSKPAVVARGAVTEDLVEDGISAVSVDSGSEDEVARALILLTTNETVSKMIGEQARRIVAERYSTEKLANTLDDTLRKLGK
jgi:glycosyltransferase involved in cell wall biosynthesis